MFVEERINAEGLQALFDALDVDPCDILSLVFAWKLGAKTPFEFSRTEFVNGCVSLEADSLEKLKAVLRTFSKQLKSRFVICFRQTDAAQIGYL